MPIPIPPDLPLEVHIPDGMPITFANYTFVQTVGGDFIVSFFQAVHDFNGLLNLPIYAGPGRIWRKWV